MHRLSRLPSRRFAFPLPRPSLPYQPARYLATTQDLASGLVLQQHDSALHLTSPALSQPLSLPFAWLRDSCQCPRCVHPSTKQKLARTGDFLTSIPQAVSIQENSVKVSWSGQAEKGAAHDSLYPLDFLTRYAEPSGQTRHTSHFDHIFAREAWDLASLPRSELVMTYESFKEDPLPAFVQVLRHGIVLLRGVPHEGTEYGMHAPSTVEGLAEVFGIVRETMYGRLWDVVSKKGSTNIAFTNLQLDLHMDLMYLQHPPHIQFLHCIKNQVEGGRSVFVDALKAANDLWSQDRDAFNLLTQTPIPFHYENDGHHLHRSHITIQLVPKHLQAPTQSPNQPPPIADINYSPPFQAPLPINAPIGLYEALRKFSDLLARPEARFEYLLKEGDCAVFDNRRVLHARTAFWDKNAMEGEAGETNRWLKGCYVERDDLMNRTRGLLAKRGAAGF